MRRGGVGWSFVHSHKYHITLGKTPPSWHLEYFLAAPSPTAPTARLVRMAPETRSSGSHPFGMFSFLFCKTFHPPAPRDSKTLKYKRNGSIRPQWWDLTLQSTKSWSRSQTQMAKWGFNTKLWKGSRRRKEHFLLTVTSLWISGLRQGCNGDKKK